MAWYDEAVFYHIYPLGLCGCAHENDGQPTPGAFAKLEAWAAHAAKLGCTAIYIGPLFESGSHGYDTIDYRLVDRRLGDNDGFRHFVKACHEAGIHVVVDGVFNHTGREFFAFQDIQKNRENSPYSDWYRGVNFGWGSPMGDSFGYEAWQGHYELPCLNLWNPEVRQYLFDVIRFWIDEFDIDGIRLDCANVLDFNFMKEMRAQTATMKPDFWLMGEVIHGEYSRWVNPEHLYSVYTLLYTLPGIPSIYYGSEWGMEGRRTRESDDMLRPCIRITDEASYHTDLTDYISRLGQIHEEQPELHMGRYQELTLTNRQYSFARHGDHSCVITAVNNDENPASMDIPVPLHASTAENLLDHTEIQIQNGRIHITLQAGRGAILKIREE